MIFALAGNQNCGKTTLFNQLTGSNQHVGNFPGVTVDQKVGQMKSQPDCSVVDLPGIYSLRPYTNEEIVTRDFLLNEKPDGIINIVDATNIERNLYLTLQLMEMRIPMVLALNMMDEVRNNGGTINVEKMSEALGIPVVPISAAKNEGIEELVQAAVRVAKEKRTAKVIDFCKQGPVHRCIHSVCHQIEDHAEKAGLSVRFSCSKLIENDTRIVDMLQLSQNELELVEHSIIEMEAEAGMDRNAALAGMRYDFIESVCADTVIKCEESKEHIRSVKIDSILTHKYFAIPIFILVMFLVFFLTFNVFGAVLSDLLSMLIDDITALVDKGLTAYGINLWYTAWLSTVSLQVWAVFSASCLSLWYCFSSCLFWKIQAIWQELPLSWINSSVRLVFPAEASCLCWWALAVRCLRLWQAVPFLRNVTAV